MLEGAALQGIVVHPDGARLSFETSSGGGTQELGCRLVLDCMGHASPVVKQLR